MIIQAFYYLYVSAGVNYATQKAARQIFTGSGANTSPMNINLFINNILCPYLPLGVSCANIVVNAQTVTTEYLSSGASSWWQFMNGAGKRRRPMSKATVVPSGRCADRSRHRRRRSPGLQGLQRQRRLRHKRLAGDPNDQPDRCRSEFFRDSELFGNNAHDVRGHVWRLGNHSLRPGQRDRERAHL